MDREMMPAWPGADAEPAVARALGLAAGSSRRAPHLIVEAAAAAGFGFVDLRVRPASAAAAGVGPLAGTPESRRTLAALAGTGLRVEDVGGLVVDPACRAGDWRATLAAAAALGARTVSVVLRDGDAGRRRDTLAALTEDALSFALVPTLRAEPGSVLGIGAAADLAREVGCLVLPDSARWSREAPDVSDVAVRLHLADAARRSRHAAPADTEALLLPGDGHLDLAGFLARFPAWLPVTVALPERGGAASPGAGGTANADGAVAAACREAYAALRASLEAASWPQTVRPPRAERPRSRPPYDEAHDPSRSGRRHGRRRP